MWLIISKPTQFVALWKWKDALLVYSIHSSLGDAWNEIDFLRFAANQGGSGHYFVILDTAGIQRLSFLPRQSNGRTLFGPNLTLGDSSSILELEHLPEKLIAAISVDIQLTSYCIVKAIERLFQAGCSATFNF